MTISNTTRTAGPFICNGITKDFPFSYKVFGRDDVLVAVTVTASGVETIKTLDADYSVTLNADQNSNPGGVIRMNVAPAAGTTLAATSNVDIIQPLDLTNNGGFYPRVINDALDRLVINIQQLAAKVGVGNGIGSAAAIAGIISFIANVAGAAGAGLIGFIMDGLDAVKRTVLDKLRDHISPKDYGAIADGIADDSAALALAIARTPAGRWLDGHGFTYKVNAMVAVAATAVRMRNFNFVVGDSYGVQGAFQLTSDTVELLNINVDGGRGTYKTGTEAWTKFAAFAGYDSIRPTLAEFFKVISWDSKARTTVHNVHFKNLHAEACIEVQTYGSVSISDCTYRNVSNKTYHVYHSPDDGINQAGSTQVSNVYAKDVGLLPDAFTVDGVAKTFATTTAFPQGAFNFIVSHGDYTANNIAVENYASTGICADRNKRFNATGVTVRNTSNRAVSNNPSGALWLENVLAANISDVVLDIQARDPRDTALDSSALELFCTNSVTNITNLVIFGNGDAAQLRKGVRASVKNNARIVINGFYISGLYAARPFDCGILPDSVIGHDISLVKGYIEAGDLNVDQPKSFAMESVNMAGNVTVSVSGNANITGSVRDISIMRSRIGNFTNFTPVTGALRVGENDAIGLITCGTANTGHVQIYKNLAINGITASGPAATVGIHDNALIGDTTIIGSAKNVRFSGNMTSRRVELNNVQTFTVNGNTIRSDAGEPLLWFNPNAAGIMLGGIFSGNNLLIKTGTAGAGYVSIGGNAAGITELAGSNNKLTVNWS